MSPALGSTFVEFLILAGNLLDRANQIRQVFVQVDFLMVVAIVPLLDLV